MPRVLKSAALEDRQEIEDPDAESEGLADEVGESQQREGDLHGHPHPEDREPRAQADAPEVGGVVAEAVDRTDDYRQGEADPEKRPPQQRRDRRQAPAFGPRRDQLDGRLYHRVEQALPLDPLLAQHRHQADGDQVQGQQEQQPGGQRLHPSAPGDPLSLRQPLVEPQDQPLLAGSDPPGNQRLDEVGPAVLRRRVVVDAGDHRQQVLDEAEGRQRSRHEHHREDQNELLAAKGEAARRQADEDVAEDQVEEEEEGDRVAEAPGDETAADDGVGVDGAGADGGAQHRPDQERPESQDHDDCSAGNPCSRAAGRKPGTPCSRLSGPMPTAFSLLPEGGCGTGLPRQCGSDRRTAPAALR